MTPPEFRQALAERGITGSYAKKAESFGVHETTLMRWTKGELAVPQWVMILLGRLRKKRSN